MLYLHFCSFCSFCSCCSIKSIILLVIHSSFPSFEYPLFESLLFEYPAVPLLSLSVSLVSLSVVSKYLLHWVRIERLLPALFPFRMSLKLFLMLGFFKLLMLIFFINCFLCCIFRRSRISVTWIVAIYSITTKINFNIKNSKFHSF